MNEQTNLDVVRKGYEAFGNGDIPRASAPAPRRCNVDDAWAPRAADGGQPHGARGRREFFAAITKFADILRFEPKEFIAQGNKVIVIGDDTERVHATGNSVEFRWVHIFELRDGKVARFEERGDVSALVAELRTVQARV